jgi:hypothetical protein
MAIHWIRAGRGIQPIEAEYENIPIEYVDISKVEQMMSL